jgi:hypothetical protein
LRIVEPRKRPDASREQEDVVQRRRPFVLPWWNNYGHALRERLRQDQSSLQLVARVLRRAAHRRVNDPLIVPTTTHNHG